MHPPAPETLCFVPRAGYTLPTRLKLRWTMNKVMLDSNVLIAAFDQSHADHRRARLFIEGVAEFYTSPQTQGAFLRFFTRPWIDATGLRREPRMSTGSAMGHLKFILSRGEQTRTNSVVSKPGMFLSQGSSPCPALEEA